MIQIPTTLLAQLDSSVGGKVGIDHARGKNMLGGFHQPRAVLIDPLVLRTLPVREFRSGLAELVKISIALDARLFGRIERVAPRINRTAGPLLAELITKAVSLKAAVVMKDEFESGLRKTLNLGHTVGHALEAASNYRIRHGEAISIGLAVEARIAARMGLLTDQELGRILGLLRVLGLPRAGSSRHQPGEILPLARPRQEVHRGDDGLRVAGRDRTIGHWRPGPSQSSRGGDGVVIILSIAGRYDARGAHRNPQFAAGC